MSKKITYRGYACKNVQTGELDRDVAGSIEVWGSAAECKKWGCRPGLEVPTRVRVSVEEEGTGESEQARS